MIFQKLHYRLLMWTLFGWPIFTHHASTILEKPYCLVLGFVSSWSPVVLWLLRHIPQIAWMILQAFAMCLTVAQHFKQKNVFYLLRIWKTFRERLTPWRGHGFTSSATPWVMSVLLVVITVLCTGCFPLFVLVVRMCWSVKTRVIFD